MRKAAPKLRVAIVLGLPDLFKGSLPVGNADEQDGKTNNRAG